MQGPPFIPLQNSCEDTRGEILAPVQLSTHTHISGAAAGEEADLLKCSAELETCDLISYATLN